MHSEKGALGGSVLMLFCLMLKTLPLNLQLACIFHNSCGGQLLCIVANLGWTFSLSVDIGSVQRITGITNKGRFKRVG